MHQDENLQQISMQTRPWMEQPPFAQAPPQFRPQHCSSTYSVLLVCGLCVGRLLVDLMVLLVVLCLLLVTLPGSQVLLVLLILMHILLGGGRRCCCCRICPILCCRSSRLRSVNKKTTDEKNGKPLADVITNLQTQLNLAATLHWATAVIKRRTAAIEDKFSVKLLTVSVDTGFKLFCSVQSCRKNISPAPFDVEWLGRLICALRKNQH